MDFRCALVPRRPPLSIITRVSRYTFPGHENLRDAFLAARSGCFGRVVKARRTDVETGVDVLVALKVLVGIDPDHDAGGSITEEEFDSETRVRLSLRVICTRASNFSSAAGLACRFFLMYGMPLRHTSDARRPVLPSCLL